jgi:hypothetical protein
MSSHFKVYDELVAPSISFSVPSELAYNNNKAFSPKY